MGHYVSHEREENHKLQGELRDLVEQSQRSKADVAADAERLIYIIYTHMYIIYIYLNLCMYVCMYVYIYILSFFLLY